MRKIFLGALGMLAILLLVRYCARERADADQLEESSELIQQQIENVAKLIVTEGHFAEVYNYKDARQLFGPLISAEKKALVVVNADVTIAYDLRKIRYVVDDETKTLRIHYIPPPEVNINPDFEYYDVQADFLNPFEAGDYNTIKERVNESLLRKIRASNLLSNARNRLLSELSKLILLTNTLEWTLEYADQPVGSLRDLDLPD